MKIPYNQRLQPPLPPKDLGKVMSGKISGKELEEKHQKSCTKSNPMSRSTKDKNFSARTSIEKSFENTFVTSSKNKYVVHEKDENADNTEPRVDLPKSNQPTYVSIRKSSNAEAVTDPKEAVSKTNKPIYVSIRRSSKVKENIIEENDEPSIDDIVKVVKESKILQNKENREELLLIITNFLKFKC